MAKPKAELSYPDLPEGQNMFTMGEACKLCSIHSHVLRYLENNINKLAKVERRNSRRYYSPSDIFMIRKINSLRARGLSTKGVNSVLSGKSGSPVTDSSPSRLPELRDELNAIIKLLS